MAELKQISIEKPNYTKSYYDNVRNKYIHSSDNIILNIIEKTEKPAYLYWNEIKYKNWIPSNYNPLDFWLIVKFIRSIKYIQIPIKSQNGEYFKYYETNNFREILFKLTNYQPQNDYTKFLKSSFIEESISSSQIEGAHTTRSKAKKIILGDEKPSNNSDQMILNNFQAMEALQSKYKNEDLSLNMIKELHKILTLNDKEIEENKKGIFRLDEDEIIIGDNLKQEYSYKTPNVDFLNTEIQELIKFANNNDVFIHPIIKAIMIHFWFSYLHPFVDGNGRLARCLFYWFLLKHNLEIFAYYPISSLIKKSRKQYDNAFIYTEQDDNDLNYFIDYNLRKMLEAKEQFEKYIKEKNIIQDSIDKISMENELNFRQEQILKDINLNKYLYITMTYYMNLFNISKPTAIKDLQDLEDKKILLSKKVGREIRYYKNR